MQCLLSSSAAKVPPQRQQIPIATGLPPHSVAMQSMSSGSEYTSMPTDLSLASQSGTGQLLLSQTQKSQAPTMVAATTVGSLASAIPGVAAATSLAAQHGDR
jgi:hypothetical protein